MENTPVYECFIDEDTDVFAFALTENPAIIKMGVAFATNKGIYHFTDDVKMRIIAPILTPSLIPREDKGGRFFIKFTEQIVEKLAHLYNSRESRGIVNSEHTDKVLPVFLAENWVVEDKNDKAFKYLKDLPMGSWVGVFQFTDREAYNEAVAEGKTGISIEAFLSSKLLNFKITDMSETLKLSTSFEKDGKRYHLTDGVVTSVEEMEEEVKVEETTEEKTEEMAEEPVSTESTGEYYSKSEVDALVNGLVEEIATLKNTVAEMTPKVEEEEMTSEEAAQKQASERFQAILKNK